MCTGILNPRQQQSAPAPPTPPPVPSPPSETASLSELSIAEATGVETGGRKRKRPGRGQFRTQGGSTGLNI